MKRSVAEVEADLRALAWDSSVLMKDRQLACEAADLLVALWAQSAPRLAELSDEGMW